MSFLPRPACLTFLFVLIGILGHAQGWMVDLGTFAKRERFHDAIILLDPNSQQPINLVVGLTNDNVTTDDQITVSCLDNVIGTTIYQKRYPIAYPSNVKPGPRMVITNVKIAYDNALASSNFCLAGSFTRYNSAGTLILGYGFFTSTITVSTGNIVSIKRWESTLPNVTGTAVAAVTAANGNYYLTGNITYATAPNRMVVLAINGSNNLLWNRVDQWVPVSGNTYSADIVFSPYQPAGMPEIVTFGHTRPSNQAVAQALFVRRLNATTGAVIAQYFINNPNLPSPLSAATVIPSRSMAGVYDGFFLYGTREDNSATNCAWITKVTPACNTVLWSKTYRYQGATHPFTAGDIAEASTFYPNQFVFVGTASPGISGPTTDAGVASIDANGSILFFVSPAFFNFTANFDETAMVVKNSLNPRAGFCIYGDRFDPSNYQLSDMYAIHWGELTSTSAYFCDEQLDVPYQITNIGMAATAFSTTDDPVLAAQSLGHGITNWPTAQPICYDPLLPGIPSKSAGGFPQMDADHSIFPNPSIGRFTLCRTASTTATVTIFNATGIQCGASIHTTDAACPIDLSTCPQGIYFVQIKEGNRVSTLRAIKL